MDESNDTFLDLMSVVQEERCYQCKLEDVEACPYRIAMLNWSVPVFNEECDEGECPYKVVTYRDWETDRKSTRLNSSHSGESRMPSSP